MIVSIYFIEPRLRFAEYNINIYLFIISPGRIHAQYIKHKRSILTIVQYAINSITSYFYCAVVRPSGIWFWLALAIGIAFGRLWNGKKYYESFYFGRC